MCSDWSNIFVHFAPGSGDTGITAAWIELSERIHTCIHANVILNEMNTVELQWLEHLWNHENMFEIWVVRANKC